MQNILKIITRLKQRIPDNQLLGVKNFSHLLSQNNKLILILLLALLLRLIGITHGYPYVFNVDEPALVRSTMGLRFSSVIDHFDWPHFNYYFHFVFYWIFIKLRALAQVLNIRTVLEKPFPILWNDPFVFYFISRVLNACLSMLTLIPVYLLGKSLFSKRVGLIGALFLALIPFHVLNAHYAQQEPALLFWLMWAIYFSYKVTNSKNLTDFVMTGVFFAFASGVKYNAALFIVTPPVFFFIEWFTHSSMSKSSLLEFIRQVWKKLVLIGVTTVFVFVMSNYRIIKDWDVFWSYEYGKGFLWQIKLNSQPLSLSDYPFALINQLFAIAFDLGIVVFVLFILGGGIAFTKLFKGASIKKSRSELYASFFFLLSIFYIFYISKFGRASSHYYIPVYGIIALASAYAVTKMRNFVLWSSVLVLFVFSVKQVVLLVRADTREISLAYKDKVINLGGEVFYSGSKLRDVNYINNLGLSEYKEGVALDENDAVISENTLIEDGRIELTKLIDNTYRNGPILYIYAKN